MVGKASLHRHRVQANKTSGPNTLSFFKKREEFSSDEEYGNYVRANIKPSLIVQYMGHLGQSHPLVPTGTLGQMGHFHPSSGIGDILVQWQNGAAVVHDMNQEKLSVELIADVVR